MLQVGVGWGSTSNTVTSQSVIHWLYCPTYNKNKHKVWKYFCNYKISGWWVVGPVHGLCWATWSYVECKYGGVEVEGHCTHPVSNNSCITISAAQLQCSALSGEGKGTIILMTASQPAQPAHRKRKPLVMLCKW